MLYIFCWFQRSVQRHTINTNIRIQMQSFVQTCLNYLYEYWFLWLSMPTNIHNTSQWKVWAYKFSILNRQVFFSPPFLFTLCLISFTYDMQFYFFNCITKPSWAMHMKIMMMVCDIFNISYSPIQSIQWLWLRRKKKTKEKNTKLFKLTKVSKIDKKFILNFITSCAGAYALEPLMCAIKTTVAMQCVSFTMHTLVLFQFYEHVFFSALLIPLEMVLLI